jgi:hypothetical protein
LTNEVKPKHIGGWETESEGRIKKTGDRRQKTEGKVGKKEKGEWLRSYRMYRAEINAAFTVGAVLFADCRLVINQLQRPCAACINAAAAAEADVSIYGDRHRYPFFSPAKKYLAGSFRGFS